MVAETMMAFGRIDILVNNAGFLDIFPIVDMPLAAWQAVMATHLQGTFLTTQCVLPQMLERRDGKIINIASQLAYKGRAGLAHYCAAKAGIIAFTRVLALEVSRQGVYANCIAPGPIAHRDHSAHRAARSGGRGALRRLAPDWACGHGGRGGADRCLSGLGRLDLLRRSSAGPERGRRDALTIAEYAGVDGWSRTHLPAG